MPARQTYLIAETHAIAQPLVAALGLKRSDELPKLRCYASDTLLLAESRSRAAGGSPAVAGAVTASYLLGSAGHDAATRLFYVGSCAARRGAEAFVGRVVLANRVVDGLSGKGYYPDILLAHELTEAGIETLPPGPEAPPDRPGLVDRELAGFLAAALTFLAPHQVYCLAAVTGIWRSNGRESSVQGNTAGTGEGEAAPAGAKRDAATGPAAALTDAGALVGASMEAILRLIEQASRLLRPERAPLSPAARRAIEEVAAAMRLTAVQSAQLRSLAEGAAANGRSVEELLAAGRRPARTKQERNRGFDELKRLFRQ